MSTEEKRQQLRRQLIVKLREMFQMDQADLDFGIYRIMNAKRDEVERFLEHDLLPTLRSTLEQFQPAGQADKQRALAEAIEGARKLKIDPEAQDVVQQLRAELAETVDLDRLEEQVYSDLHTFFSRYYQNGDFMSLRRYKEGVYALPYEGEEVKLHWANADQYYIKSAENFTRYAFKTPQGRVRFELAAAGTERDNNKASAEGERRFILCADPLDQQDGDLVIHFEYRPDPDKRKQKELNALAVESLLGLPAISVPDMADWPQWRAALAAPLPTDKNKTRTTLEKHLSDYTAKNTFDYFIHKDLGRFLRRELDFFIKNEVMHLDDIEEQTAPAVEQYLARIKAMRRIAHKLIAFLAQLENFQKRLWLKKKFVLETNWLITLDRIDPRHYPEICRQAETPVRGWDGATRNQREEWVKLFAIEEILPTSADGKDYGPATETGAGTAGPLFDQVPQSTSAAVDPATGAEPVPPFAKGGPGGISATSATTASVYSIPLSTEFLQANPFLVLDTAFITPALKDEILAGFENLDEQTNGLLVHGENFQALNLLRERYREQVKCIYIDPPYNTGGDGFPYKDGYQHSSWASMINDRIGVAANFLSKSGAIFVSIDENESNTLRKMLGNEFGDENMLAEFVWLSEGNFDNQAKIKIGHEYILAFARSEVDFPFPSAIDPSASEGSKLFNKEIRNTIVKNGPKNPVSKIFLPAGFPADFKRGVISARSNSWPRYSEDVEVDEFKVKNGVSAESGWSSKALCETFIAGSLNEVDDSKGQKTKFILTKTGAIESVKQRSSKHGYVTSIIKSVGTIQSTSAMLEHMGVPYPHYPKPVKLVSYIAEIAGPEDGVVLDFFSGSGTTAHAIIGINRDGVGNLKYVCVENGASFDSIIMPRVGKNTYSSDWKNAKPLKVDGISSCTKYLRLESYEDACDNLALVRSETQQAVIDQAPALREGYFLNYLLDIESRASLLNLDKFNDPFNVAMSITRNDETREVKVDLPETFNYLLGLRVSSQRRLKGVYEVTGTTPAGDSALILWRNTREVDNDALDDWFRKQAYNTRDREFDLIYVNGDNNLENLRCPDETWKVRLIEEAFHTLMFAVEEV
jgi:adenine-specific DNA-methyltransferase